MGTPNEKIEIRKKTSKRKTKIMSVNPKPKKGWIIKMSSSMKFERLKWNNSFWIHKKEWQWVRGWGSIRASVIWAHTKLMYPFNFIIFASNDDALKRLYESSSGVSNKVTLQLLLIIIQINMVKLILYVGKWMKLYYE